MNRPEGVQVNFESSPGVSIKTIYTAASFIETLWDRFMDCDEFVVEGQRYQVISMKDFHRDENGDRKVDCRVKDLGPQYIETWDC